MKLAAFLALMATLMLATCEYPAPDNGFYDSHLSRFYGCKWKGTKFQYFSIVHCEAVNGCMTTPDDLFFKDSYEEKCVTK